jgi:hypothetical protein
VQTVNGPEWHAAWGSRIDNFSASAGINAAPFGATASGLPMLGGLMTRDEVSNRSIPHALALAIPQTAAGRFVWPANRTDGNSTAANAIPEGTRFRLDPSVNVDNLGLPPLAQAMARAAQRYGIVVRDRADAVTFYAEDLGPLGITQDFGGLTPGALLARFPWQQLQVVEPTRSSGMSSAAAGSARGAAKRGKSSKARRSARRG